MTYTEDDYRYMARAIQLAKTPLVNPHPNPRVGCIIVQDNKIVAEGYHESAGKPHAEINALRQCAIALENATMYVTLEPCCHIGRTGACTEAVIASKVSKVIIAMLDPNPKMRGNGIKKLETAGTSVFSGLLEDQAKQLNKGFVKRMQENKPWVQLKIAASIDGCTAMSSGESQWITGESARKDVQKMRASCDAILTGSGTVISDDPRLTVRLSEYKDIAKQPLRIVIDSQSKLDNQYQIFNEDGNVLLATLPTDNNLEFKSNVEVKTFPINQGKIDLEALFTELAKREINHVLVESGEKLNGALLMAGLVDEIVVYVASSIMGSQTKRMFETSMLNQMNDKISLQLEDFRKVGNDLRLTYIPKMDVH